MIRENRFIINMRHICIACVERFIFLAVIAYFAYRQILFIE